MYLIFLVEFQQVIFLPLHKHPRIHVSISWQFAAHL